MPSSSLAVRKARCAPRTGLGSTGNRCYPITAFGGAGPAAYNEEIKEFDGKYSDRIERSDYDVLNQVSGDMRKIARDAVALAARIQASRQVFAIMSYSSDPKLQDAYDSFQEVCGEYGYVCKRVDDMTTNERIVPMIIDGIRKSAFVIADLTEPRPNVYYEFGLAQGLAKSYIVTAYKGTTLPFDVTTCLRSSGRARNSSRTCCARKYSMSRLHRAAASVVRARADLGPAPN